MSRGTLSRRADRLAAAGTALAAASLAVCCVFLKMPPPQVPEAVTVRIRMHVAKPPAPPRRQAVPESPRPPALSARSESPESAPRKPEKPRETKAPLPAPEKETPPPVRTPPEEPAPVPAAETAAAAPAEAAPAKPEAPAPSDADDRAWLQALTEEISKLKRYPASARRAGQEGTGVLSVTVSAEGAVLSAELFSASGRPALDAALSKLAGKLKGRALPAAPASERTVRVPVRFVLTEGR